MCRPLSHADLKAKQRERRSNFPENMSLRVHRSISWIGRAENTGDDHDACFLFLWIAFNAAYADEHEIQIDLPNERSRFSEFFGKVLKLDAGNRIHAAIWEKFSGPIRIILQNQYVFSPFWKYHNGIPEYEDWEQRFIAAARMSSMALQNGDTGRVLGLVFDRLYVLRNQLMHGGATWNGSVNRDQVRDGASILAFLMPVFVDIMMDNPSAPWGRPFYPVVD